MGYYLPAKSYLKPKPKTSLRRKLIAASTTGVLLTGTIIILTSLQFGDNKSTFAHEPIPTKSDEIQMPVPLHNTNAVTSEIEAPLNTDFPVILAYFKTVRFTKSVQLKWSTMLEYQNDYFTVEKSENGTNFYEIGCVHSKNSKLSSDYTFTDEDIKRGPAFYRLIQTSDNGKSTYVALEKVSGENENDGLSLFIDQVGPLPFGDYFNINYFTIRGGGVSVELFDKTGKNIFKTYTEATEGYNTCRFIDGKNLIDDEYTLRLSNSIGAYVKKIKKRV